MGLLLKQRNKILKQQGGILAGEFRHPLRVPLCSEDGGGKMNDGFRRFIRRILDNLEIFAGDIDALVVIAVDKHMGAKEGMEKTAGQIIGGMQYVFCIFLVEPAVCNFPDGAVEVQIDELHSFAYAENGLFLFAKQVQRSKLLQIKKRFG